MKYHNNPFNIRSTNAKWIGLSSPKHGFCQFKELKFGIRCAYYLIFKSYLKLNPFMTIEEMITRYAPASDGNDLESYLHSIKLLSGHARDYQLCNLSIPQRASLLSSMAWIESHTKLDSDYIIKVIHEFF